MLPVSLAAAAAANDVDAETNLPIDAINDDDAVDDTGGCRDDVDDVDEAMIHRQAV